MTTIVTARECPRCEGKMELNRDHYGEYWDCLQCGNHINTDEPLPYVQQVGGHERSRG